MVSLTIYGQPCSKSNRRKLVMIGGRPALIKSKEALAYERDAHKQMRKLPQLIEGKVSVTMRLFYASERPDLDASLILDCLQGYYLKNDRQVRELHLFHAVDKNNPRAEIEIEPMQNEMVFENPLTGAKQTLRFGDMNASEVPF